AFEFFDGSQPTWGAQFADYFVFAALIVGRRSEPARRRAFQLDAFDVSVKGEIEVQAGLLAIGDDVESGGQLVMQCGNHRVILKFGAVSFAELVQMLTTKLQPARKRITADNAGAQRIFVHTGSVPSSA